MPSGGLHGPAAASTKVLVFSLLESLLIILPCILVLQTGSPGSAIQRFIPRLSSLPGTPVEDDDNNEQGIFDDLSKQQ